MWALFFYNAPNLVFRDKKKKNVCFFSCNLLQPCILVLQK